MFFDAIAISAAYMVAFATPEQRFASMMARIRDKETNMRNRLERRRHAIWWKWISRATWGVAALFAMPLIIAGLNWCWSLVLG